MLRQSTNIFSAAIWPALFLAVASIGAARAETVTFKQGADIDLPSLGINITNYNGAPDTYLLNGGQFSGGLSNYGNGSPIRTNGSGVVSGNRKSLIRFDVSALANQYSSIDSVMLRLHVESTGGAGGVNLLRLTRANSIWSEGSHFGGTLIPANNGNRTSYQNVYGSSMTWAGGPGANTSGVDFRATALGSASNGDWTAGGTVDIPLSGDGQGGTLTDLMDDWVQTPRFQDGWFTDPNNPLVPVSNEGMFIRGMDGTQNNFHSGESGGGLEPELIVTFTSVVPEPSTLLLAGLGLVVGAMLRLRRRGMSR